MSVAPIELMYGSDRAGVVCAYEFTPDQAGRSIESDEAAALLEADDKRDRFVWLHFSLANAATEQWLRQHAGLPDVFFESQDASSTRLEVVGEALMGVLNDVRVFAVEASSPSSV